MNDPSLFANLGIGGVTLFIIWTMIKFFMATIDKKDALLETKDTYIVGLIKDFQSHVEMCNTNFINSSNAAIIAADKQTKAIEVLMKRINTLERR